MATFDKEYDVPDYEYVLDENDEEQKNTGASKYDLLKYFAYPYSIHLSIKNLQVLTLIHLIG